MKQIQTLIVMAIFMVLGASLVVADFNPREDIDGKDTYNIHSFQDINGTRLYQNGSRVLDSDDIDGTTFNYSLHANDSVYWDGETSQANLNVNKSTWWGTVSSFWSKWFYSAAGVFSLNETQLNNSITAIATEFNDTMTSYVDSQDTAFNDSMKVYVDNQDTTFNDSMKDYSNSQNTALNTSLRSYVDSQDTTFNSSLASWVTNNLLYYMLLDGTTSLTSNWDQGEFNLTNLNSWFLGKVPWGSLENYPAACPSGTYITQNGDSNICTAPTAEDLDPGTFPSGNYTFNGTVTADKFVGNVQYSSILNVDIKSTDFNIQDFNAYTFFAYVPPYCYQESTNNIDQTGIDGGCGLDYEGEFLYSSPDLYVNYTKPSAGVIGAIWKNRRGPYIENITIPEQCWNASETELMLLIDVTGSADSQPKCYNGTAWESIGQFRHLYGGFSGTETEEVINDGSWDGKGCMTYGCKTNCGYGGCINEEAIFWVYDNNNITSKTETSLDVHSARFWDSYDEPANINVSDFNDNNYYLKNNFNLTSNPRFYLFSKNAYCEQKSPNVSTGCGDNDLGVWYSVNMNGQPASNAFDNNLSTYALYGSGLNPTGYIYMNYTVPNNTVRDSTLFRMDYHNGAYSEKNIPSDCWSDVVQMRAQSRINNDGVRFSCYNLSSSSWTLLFYDPAGYHSQIYELGMKWVIDGNTNFTHYDSTFEMTSFTEASPGLTADINVTCGDGSTSFLNFTKGILMNSGCP